MFSLIAAASLAGLLGSPHCVGMCGGFASACGRRGDGLALWHAGRLTTYAALGALAGTFGAVLPGPAWVPAALSLGLLVWFALALAGVVPEPAPRLPWLGRLGALLFGREGLGWRYVFGLFNGLLPCGMVYAALSIAIAAASPLAGTLVLLGFGLGTVPALTLFPDLVRRFARRGVWQRRAVATLVLAAGLWSVSTRVQHAPAHASHGPDAPAAPANHHR
jgi:uncharacterized protein